MKNSYLLGIFYFMFLFIGVTCFSQTGYVTIQGRQFKDGEGNNFNPVVCNYVVDVVTPSGSVNDFSTSYISPEGGYGISPGYECDEANCNDYLLADFNEILKLGFNTVRIMGVRPLFYTQGQTWTCWDSITTYTFSSSGFYIEAHPHDSLVLGTCAGEAFYLVNGTDANSQVLFEHIRNILLVASQANYQGKKLKVILITGGAAEQYYNEDYTNSYDTYLSALTTYLTTNLTSVERETLIAYDLFNEPGFCWAYWSRWPYVWNGEPTKEHVCKSFRMWNKTIKDIDPSYLITVGGWADGDIFDFDPNILALDFYSLHIYPLPKDFEGTDPVDKYKNEVNRIKARYYWCKNNLSLPWIIGETGFQANDLGGQGFIDGSELQQQQYAFETLNDVWKCEGSGYSWWTYQDEFFNPWSYAYFGIITNGEVPNNVREKPVSQVFENFPAPVPSCNCECPEDPQDPHPQHSTYFDPFEHSYYAYINNLQSSFTNTISGTVLNEAGDPIKDAVIVGTSYLKPGRSNTDPPYLDSHYTFSESNGVFHLIPYNYVSVEHPELHLYNYIYDMQISALGSERQARTTNNVFPDGYMTFPSIEEGTTGETFQLKQPIYNSNYNNIEVHASEHRDLSALSVLTGANINYEPGSSGDITARIEVRIVEESKFSGEVHLFNTPTFLDCDFLSAFYDVPHANELKKQESISSDKFIELSFNRDKENINFSVYPNPNDGIFSVTICDSGEMNSMYQIKIFNLIGSLIYQTEEDSRLFTVNLSSLPQGIYTIQVDNKTSLGSKKLIIN